MATIKVEDLYEIEPKLKINEEVRPKTCVVCGDNTKSYHYETPSCYGCKTFFRRAVVGNKIYVCANNGKCVITKDTRCICRSCRLKKCYEVGMNPHAVGVMTLMKKKRMLQNSGIKQEITDIIEEKPSTSCIIMPMLKTNYDDYRQCVNEILYIEGKHEYLRHSNFCPYDEELSLLGSLYKKTSFADADKYHLVHVWPRIDIFSMAKMSGYRLAEVGLKSWFFVDLLLSIDYLKTLDVFQKLPIKDQFYLSLDVTITIAHISRNYYSFLMGSEIVIHPDGTYPFIHRENLMGIETILRAGKVKSVRQLNPDRIHFCLMKAIAAFTSTSLNISQESHMMIEKGKIKYAKILLHYLQEKHGVKEGASKFADSLSLISEFVTLTKKYSNVYHSFRHCLDKTRSEQKLPCELRDCNSKFCEKC